MLLLRFFYRIDVKEIGSKDCYTGKGKTIMTVAQSDTFYSLFYLHNCSMMLTKQLH